MYEIKTEEMVRMSSSEIWKTSNAIKYTCIPCQYATHNKTLFCRHCNTTKHFLHTEYQTAPRLIHELVKSFLKSNYFNSFQKTSF